MQVIQALSHSCSNFSPFFPWNQPFWALCKASCRALRTKFIVCKIRKCVHILGQMTTIKIYNRLFPSGSYFQTDDNLSFLFAWIHMQLDTLPFLNSIPLVSRCLDEKALLRNQPLPSERKEDRIRNKSLVPGEYFGQSLVRTWNNLVNQSWP